MKERQKNKFKKLKKNSILTLVLALSVSFLFFGKVEAFRTEKYDDNIEDRFVITPVKLDLKMKPGETKQEEFIVVNRLGKPTEFFIHKEDFQGSDDLELATIFLGEEASAMSAKEWIKPDIDKFSLQQGERGIINLEISVPENAEAGGHYSAVFAGVKGENANSKDQVNLITRAGVLVLITVEGEIKRTGFLESFNINKNFFLKGPVKFSTIFKNEGNVHLKPRGEISISNLVDSNIALIPLEEWIVLPESRRKKESIWNKQWLLGRYEARLKIFLDNESNDENSTERSPDFERSIVFWAFPWHFAVGIFLIFMVGWKLSKMFLDRFEIKRKPYLKVSVDNLADIKSEVSNNNQNLKIDTKDEVKKDS